MDINVRREVAALGRMTVGELRAKYANLFGEATNARHKEWLIRRIAWRIQAKAEGDLTERARQRAAELANDADLRVSAPKAVSQPAQGPERTKTTALRVTGDNRLPIPGTIITRKYKGQTLQVRVLPDAFEFEGETYKSLSAVAKAATGSHCNGYLFFRLRHHGGGK
jgi:Protein of unknown function (DUF2924)